MNLLKSSPALKCVLIALASLGATYCAYAVLASACDNYYYENTSTGYTSVHLTYNEATDNYKEEVTTYNTSGFPTEQKAYNNLSEYSTGQILSTVLDPNGSWYEES